MATAVLHLFFQFNRGLKLTDKEKVSNIESEFWKIIFPFFNGTS